MTNRFVRSGGDAGAWTGTVATLAAGLASPTVAGDDIFVAADHVDPVSATLMTITSLGTQTLPCRIFVADHTVALSGGNVVPAALISTPTVLISTSGASGITTAGVVSECRGFIFSAGTVANVATITLTGFWNFKNCSFILGNTATTSVIRPGGNSQSRTIWDDCAVKFGATAQSMAVNGGDFIWKNTANPFVVGSVFSSSGMFSGASGGSAVLRGVDFSSITPAASKPLVAGGVGIVFNVALINCKEPAAWVPLTGVQTGDFLTTVRERSENGALNYTKFKEDYLGQQSTETTIVRTGGAFDGTIQTSWKINTATAGTFTGRARRDRPYKSTPIVIWNDVAGATRTVTVYGIASALPTNADIWLEVDYLSSSASPLGTVAHTTTLTPLTAPASVATDTSTWGGALTGKFKLVATLDGSTWPQPGMKGPMTIRVCVGAQSTFYIDWQPVIS